jgi:large subunit ribosomal protein L24
MANKLKVGDEVEIIAGKDKGRRGKIKKIDFLKNKVIVEGLNMVRKHVKNRGQGEYGIMDQEAALHLSNVMMIDPDQNKPTRVGFQLNDQGKKVRFSKRSGKLF